MSTQQEILEVMVEEINRTGHRSHPKTFEDHWTHCLGKYYSRLRGRDQFYHGGLE